MVDYLRRVADDELDELLPGLPAIAIEGAKGVGKTATAERRAATVHRLDDPGLRAIAEAEPPRLAVGAPPNPHRRVAAPARGLRHRPALGAFGPYTWSLPADRLGDTRRRADAFGRRAHRHPPDAASRACRASRRSTDGKPARAAVGRAPRHRRGDRRQSRGLRPRDHRLGLPEITGTTRAPRRAQLDGYVSRSSSTTSRTWVALFATPPHCGAGSRSTPRRVRRPRLRGDPRRGDRKPRREAGQDDHGPLRDILQRLWIIEPVPAWLPTPNRIARLAIRRGTSSPILPWRRDCSASGSMVCWRGAAQVRAAHGRNPIRGLFGGFATLSVRVFAQAAGGTVYHLRTRGGKRQIDLIVEGEGLSILAIEVKLGQSVSDADVRHLGWLRGAVRRRAARCRGPDDRSGTYRRPDGIAVVPLALLGP